MPWRGHEAPYCAICGGHRDEVGPLSARYKCAQCAKRRERDNLEQLRTREGPYFRAWRQAMITSGIEWLVESGDKTEEEAEALLAFHRRSRSWRLPDIATARQRRVGDELSRYYRKAPSSNPTPHSMFLVLMNLLMQGGTPRLEAEEEAVRVIREMDDEDFTPLRP